MAGADTRLTDTDAFYTQKHMDTHTEDTQIHTCTNTSHHGGKTQTRTALMTASNPFVFVYVSTSDTITKGQWEATYDPHHGCCTCS